MAAARIVETVDVFEDGDFGITTRSPGSLPQQRGLDRLEECLDRRVDAPMFVKRQESGSVRCTELGIFRGRCIV